MTCSSFYSELVPSALCKSGVCPCGVEGEQRDDGGEKRRGKERRGGGIEDNLIGAKCRGKANGA